MGELPCLTAVLCQARTSPMWGTSEEGTGGYNSLTLRRETAYKKQTIWFRVLAEPSGRQRSRSLHSWRCEGALQLWHQLRAPQPWLQPRKRSCPTRQGSGSLTHCLKSCHGGPRSSSPAAPLVCLIYRQTRLRAQRCRPPSLRDCRCTAVSTAARSVGQHTRGL